MTDSPEDKARRLDEINEAFSEKVAMGEPLIPCDVDIPTMKLTADTAGGLRIDCRCLGTVPGGNAGVIRFSLTPAAANKLFQFLSAVRNSPDAPTPTDASPTAH